jgi:hypothetical protein
LSFCPLHPFGAHQIAALTGIGAMLLVANFVIAQTTGGFFHALPPDQERNNSTLKE